MSRRTNVGVEHMALYTRTGDKGFTLLPGPDGAGPLRVRKDDARLTALGEVDELTAAIGLCVCEAVRTEHAVIRKGLTTVQKELLRVGAVLAAVIGGRRPEVRLRRTSVARLEKQMDTIAAELPELRHFVLPGGCELAARLHLARAIARRTERAVVTMMNLAGQAHRKDSPAAVVASYLNRLSDFLFTLARLANRDAGLEDAVWKP